MAIHSSTLAWKIPWTEEPGGLQSMGRKESDRIEQLTLTLKSENEIAKIHLFKSVKHLKMPGSYQTHNKHYFPFILATYREAIQQDM